MTHEIQIQGKDFGDASCRDTLHLIQEDGENYVSVTCIDGVRESWWGEARALVALEEPKL